MVRRSSHLPPEIIEIILLKLPVKPLLRFKSVSKSWNTIVSDPIFVRNHLHQNSKPQNLFLRRIGSSYTSYGLLALVKLEDGKLETIKKLKLPFVHQLGDRLCCFTEYGLLLITNCCSDRCILWNPSTQTTTHLSVPRGSDPYCSGICYDPAFDDFKVVVVYGDLYAVYSCKKQSWSNKKQLPYTIAPYQRTGVSVNGGIYWLLQNSTGSCAEIVYYDPRDGDKLKILQKPKDAHGNFSSTYLVDLGGHLCLYCYYRNGLDEIRIWRKDKGIEKNSWKELLTIHNVDKPIWLLQPLCFVGNKILIQYKDYTKLLVYNPHDKTFEQVDDKQIGRGPLITYWNTLYALT